VHDEAFEPPAGDGARYAELPGRVVGGRRFRAATNEAEEGAELGIPECVEPIQWL
jgi:hypothetical protein